MNRILVAVVIGLILALGIYFASRLNNNDEGAAQPPADGSGEVVEETGPPSRTIARAGRQIELNPIPGQEAILLTERNGDLRAQQPPAVITTQQSVASEAENPAVAPTNTPAPAPTNPPAPTPVTPVAGNCGQITTRAHTVGAGETLYSLTRLYTTSVEQLAAYGISEASMVVGSVLNVPTTGCVCQTDRTHTVSRGENVFRLAIQYGTTKEEIQRLNGLDANYLITVNQVLCLP